MLARVWAYLLLGAAMANFLSYSFVSSPGTGGEFQDSQMMATFRELEAYDPASNTWAVLP